jgi:hypothetical protein
MRKQQPVTTLTWDEADEKRVALALAVARDSLDAKATGPDIVMEVIKMAVDIDRRTPSQGYRHGAIRSAWPKNDHSDLTPKDRDDIRRMRNDEIAAGESADVVYGFRINASANEQAIFDSVDRVFRSCLRGKNQIRDWKILFALAQGRSLRKVAKKHAISCTRVRYIRDSQPGFIWTQVCRLMPPRHALAA